MTSFHSTISSHSCGGLRFSHLVRLASPSNLQITQTGKKYSYTLDEGVKVGWRSADVGQSADVGRSADVGVWSSASGMGSSCSVFTWLSSSGEFLLPVVLWDINTVWKKNVFSKGSQWEGSQKSERLTVPLTFLIAVIKNNKKQLPGVRACFGSQFEGTNCHSERDQQKQLSAAVTGAGGTWSPLSWPGQEVGLGSNP